MKMFVCLFFVFAVAQVEIVWAKQLLGATNIPELNNPRIVVGEEAKPNQFPWHALLIIWRPNSKAICDGSLISRNWVLTAAHCIANGPYTANAVRVILGTRNFYFEEGRIQMESREFVVHENRNPKNDIGLIRLPKPVEFSERIQPVQLPSRSDRDNTFEGTLATISGWGRTSNGPGTILEDHLRFVRIPIISNAECSYYLNGTLIFDSNICTYGSQGKSPYIGEGGGPLVIGDKTQIGIASLRISSCQSGYPHVYTKITAYLDWIEKNTDVIIN